MDKLKNTSTVLSLLVLIFVHGFSQASEGTGEIVQGGNEFGIALFKRVCQSEGNVLISPYAINDVFGFLAYCSRGETQAEIQSAFRYPESTELLGKLFERYRQGVEQNAQSATVRAGGALWVQDGIPLDKALLKTTGDSFGVSAGRMDLVQRLDLARSDMNLWTQKMTGGLVAKPFAEAGDLPRSALVVLLSAFSMRADWKMPFDERKTAAAPFASPKRVVRVPCMQQTNTFEIYDMGDVSFLAVPYQNLPVEMLILLPKDKASMKKLLQRISGKELSLWRSRTWSRTVHFKLPRFSVANRVPLVPHLRALGIEDAFSDRADFSPLVGEAKAYIDLFRHEVRFDAVEDGTNIAIQPLRRDELAADSKDTPLAFHVDRPFLFVLMHTKTNAILALGRVETLAGDPIVDAPEPTPLQTKKPKSNAPTFRATPGFGPWDFGLPIDQVQNTPGGPYRYISRTGQFMTNNAIWNNIPKHTAMLGFNAQDKLNAVQLELFAGKHPDGLVEELAGLIGLMRTRYGGIVLNGKAIANEEDASALAATLLQALEAIKVERPHDPAEVTVEPKYQPPQTWISARLLYERKLGYNLSMSFRWDPGFPGTPLPKEEKAEK